MLHCFSFSLHNHSLIFCVVSRTFLFAESESVFTLAHLAGPLTPLLVDAEEEAKNNYNVQLQLTRRRPQLLPRAAFHQICKSDSIVGRVRALYRKITDYTIIIIGCVCLLIIITSGAEAAALFSLRVRREEERGSLRDGFMPARHTRLTCVTHANHNATIN